MKLTIAIVTWNRAEQLKDAIISCLKCNIPKDTQFVIIDNASTDNTEEVVKNMYSYESYEWYYEKMAENLGCGVGRNYAFSKSKGDFVYFLDDDAFIDENYNDFFVRAISYFEDDKKIATITTQIYDKMLRDNRVSLHNPSYHDGLLKCYMFCGGSHFLRKSFWLDKLPYYPNKYGYEEIFPSLEVHDKGMINAFVPDLCVIHNPKVNKWVKEYKGNTGRIIMEISSQLGMKASLYPKVSAPILFISSFVRSVRYSCISKFKLVIQQALEIIENNKEKKRIKFSTLMRLYKEFGFSIL